MTTDILAREPSAAGDAIVRLTKKEVDLIILTRQPNAAEIEVAGKSNITFKTDKTCHRSTGFQRE